jgi:hypothetical protein
VADLQQNAEPHTFLSKEVHHFMESKEKPVHENHDPQWMCDFEFLVSITGNLNELNFCL